MFVTKSSFNSGAAEFVRHLSQRVILSDGHRIADLTLEHRVGVHVPRTIAFKRLVEDQRAKVAAVGSPVSPKLRG